MESIRCIKVVCLLACALVVPSPRAEADIASFTDYGSGTTIEVGVGKGVWQTHWGQGPWTWSSGVGSPLFNSGVSGILDLHAIAPASISPDVVITLPVAGVLTLSAYDGQTLVGTMSLSGTGVNIIDGNAGRVILDEPAGMFLAPFNPPGPHVSMTLDEATGIFAGITQVGDWELQLAGFYAAPLVEGMPLQQNIFAVLGGTYPIIGGVGEFVLTGQYVPEPATIALMALGGLSLLQRRRL